MILKTGPAGLNTVSAVFLFYGNWRINGRTLSEQSSIQTQMNRLIDLCHIFA